MLKHLLLVSRTDDVYVSIIKSRDLSKIKISNTTNIVCLAICDVNLFEDIPINHYSLINKFNVEGFNKITFYIGQKFSPQEIISMVNKEETFIEAQKFILDSSRYSFNTGRYVIVRNLCNRRYMVIYNREDIKIVLHLGELKNLGVV